MTDQTSGRGSRQAASIDVRKLAILSPEDADAADDTGILAGNQHYQDLQLCSVADLRNALSYEVDLMTAFRSGADAAVAENHFSDERPLDDERLALWHLDVGVASAVIAMVILGCHPVLSCNGGEFGNTHSFAAPQIRAYLGSADLDALIIAISRAEIRLAQDEGLLVLTASSCDAFVAFARQVLSAVLEKSGAD